MKKNMFVLELNEVNFSFIEEYIKIGLLPNFSEFFARHGYSYTTSESRHDVLEPWIQWVTAHTGLEFSEHGVFRLGDIVHKDIDQIWDKLSRQGVKVGAISPMNAKCRTNDWDFFLPDPWTKTNVIASPLIRRMYDAIAQVVNDNAQAKISPLSLFNLALGGMKTANLSSYRHYMRYIIEARRKPWYKAIFLDQLLSDLFVNNIAEHKTNFATLFLNGAAHIQHHYMFSSSVYEGTMQNPGWYIDSKSDPLLDVYTAYDRVLGTLKARFPDARIMLATGLHQDPYPELAYYWRLKNHDKFLNKIGVEFSSVEPRMSRDFVVHFSDKSAAIRGANILKSAHGVDGVTLFDVDNRGEDLFVMLTYPHDVNKLDGYVANNVRYEKLSHEVAFVAIKNGQHNGIGYFSDSGLAKAEMPDSFPLTALSDRIFDAFRA